MRLSLLFGTVLSVVACTDGGGTGPGYLSDIDGDGYPDVEDACPEDASQWTDLDGDGVCDEVDDRCPEDETEWNDSDLDGVCDGKDACPDDPLQSTDADGDGYCDETDDACPDDAEEWLDSDGDGVCDGKDACPQNEAESVDSDGDGVCDGEDDCPSDEYGWRDSDGDGDCDLTMIPTGMVCLISKKMNPVTAWSPIERWRIAMAMGLVMQWMRFLKIRMPSFCCLKTTKVKSTSSFRSAVVDTKTRF